MAIKKIKYVIFTTMSLILPGSTPLIQNLQGIIDLGEYNQLKTNWHTHKTEHENIVNMNKAVTTLLIDLIPYAYKIICKIISLHMLRLNSGLFSTLSFKKRQNA